MPDEAVFGSFVVQELVSSSGDVRVFRARDQHVDRPVLLRVAGESSAGFLLEDARRIAAVPHPGLVAVLGASLSESGAYAAVGDIGARPLSEAGSLSAEQGARVAADITGAVAALAEAGLRARVDAATVLVVRDGDGVRGLLDPLRGSSPGRSCLEEADLAVSTSELAALLESAVPEPGEAAEPRRRAPRALVAVCLGIAVLGIALFALDRSRGTSQPKPVPRAAVARVIARIPLGLASEEPASGFARLGRDLWIVTRKGRLLRVDPATNRVVGSPVALPGKHAVWDVAEIGGRLFATDDAAGWLLRIDPERARITAQRRLADHVSAMTAAGGVLWVSGTNGSSKGVVMRVDPDTLRVIGRPLIGVAAPWQIVARGSRAWVLGSDGRAQVARVDAASGERILAFVGAQAASITLAGDMLWIGDTFNGTLSALDAERMAFTRPALKVLRAVDRVFALGPDLWAAAARSGRPDGQHRLERFDATTGRRAGRPVAIGGGFVAAISPELGSLWVLGPTTLTRLAPTTPRPQLAAPAALAASPRALAPGPLAPGAWRTTVFDVPLTFSVPAFKWLGLFPEPDAVTLLGAGTRDGEFDIDAPRQVFAADGSTRQVRSPAGLLDELRRNPQLEVGDVRHVTIAGRPALQFTMNVRGQLDRHPEVCGPVPCVLLFPLHEGTLWTARDQGASRTSLLQIGARTIVIFEGGDRATLAASAALVRTIRFGH